MSAVFLLLVWRITLLVMWFVFDAGSFLCVARCCEFYRQRVVNESHVARTKRGGACLCEHVFGHGAVMSFMSADEIDKVRKCATSIIKTVL